MNSANAPATTTEATEATEATEVTLRETRWQDLARLADLESELFGPQAWSLASWWGELAARPRRAYVTAVRGGEIVERGTAEQVMREPAHPYTRMLVEAAREDSVHRPTAAAPPGLAAAPATTDTPGTPNAQGATE